MKLKELEFQDTAIKKLVSSSLGYLKERGNSVIVFQAPTGSGKTVMMAKALSEIVRDTENTSSLSFIWISVNSLHEQSKDSLEQYFAEEKVLQCIDVSDIDNSQIQQNEILFVNWESLNKEKAIFIRDNEKDWNLNKVVENTKEEGREIVLIIDESHRSAKTSKALDLVEVIGPKVTVEVSATPIVTDSDIRIKVPLEDVIDEEMIKSEIQINPGLLKAETNEDIIEAALKKRRLLASSYTQEGVNINPLLLIQIPNKHSGEVRNPEDRIIDILRDCGITIENGKLAIWLSAAEDKKNLDDIKKKDSQVEVLIFKEAIALGWDCPRASILLLQREWNAENYVFNIQTLGRIMRMPEHRYYPKHPELNLGYVYTATNNFSIIEELAEDYVSRVQMIRDEQRYSNLLLPSQFIRRKREKTRLSGQFRHCLQEAETELNLKDKVNTSVAAFTKQIGVGGSVEGIDKKQTVDFKNEASITKGREEVSLAYTTFIGSQTAPFSRARSTEIIKSSIRLVFKGLFGIDNEDTISAIVINPANKPLFSDLIELAKKKYKELPEVEDIVHDNNDWQVPPSISVFDPFVASPGIKKSILLPYYLKVDKNDKKRQSGPETSFITGLESTDDYLKWWYKNGERESKFFGIAYETENGRKYAFYPDFILRTKKEIIIVETKDDSDFKNENLLKLNAGKQYVRQYSGTEKVSFSILSPVDFERFFRHLDEQTLENFTSKYEDNLRQVSASRKIVADKFGAKNEDDRQLLEEYDEELTKAFKDQKKLELSLADAQAIIENMKVALSKTSAKSTDVSGVEIPRPFNICILGDVVSEPELQAEARTYFAKYGLAANDWSIEVFNNTKLRNSDVLGKAKQGQSKYNLIITAQIHHHSGKGNQSANILTELKNDKYVASITPGTPKELLTTASLISALEAYVQSNYSKATSS